MSTILRQARKLNSATFFGIAAKVSNGLNWLVVAGAVSTHMSKTEQGFFFTFLSLATLQMLFDLGLGTAIVQFSAHEWAALRGQAGNAAETPAGQRLGSVARFSIYWYLGASVVFFAALQAVGHYLFADSAAGTDWAGPWHLLSFAVSVDLATLGCWSTLEGCNQIYGVYLYRALKSVVLGIVVWVSVLKGLGLYSLGLGYLTTLPFSIGLLARGEHRRLLGSILKARGEHHLHWRREILPLQWRLAISFGSGYFAQWGITPITFKLFNPAVAGQFGMMWSIINAISAVANVVVTVQAPRYGVLIASRRYTELDRLALRYSIFSIGLSFLGCATVALIIYVLNQVDAGLAGRVLPFRLAAIMLAASALGQILNPFAVYLRSHKKEPYLWISLGFAAGLVLSTFLGGRWFGPIGVSIAYFVLVAGFFLPCGTWIFIRCRSLWHAPAAEPTLARQPGRA